jgi:flagellar biosynthesis protein FlhF
MPLHTFHARSLPEALRLVRQELGPDASVLHTRTVGSLLSRWWGGPTVEVTASAELQAPARLLPPAGTPDADGPANAGYGVYEERVRVPAAELDDFRHKIQADLRRAARIEPSLVEQLAAGPAQRPPRFPHLARRLAQCGVSARASQRWLERLEAELTCDPEQHADAALDRLIHIVAAELPVRVPALVEGEARVVALVGPSGVGKTTTLAKLAARARLDAGRSVALVTVDTYRIAAVDQLRTYAEILDLPMEVVATPGEMAAAIHRLGQHDLILIDTAGRSPFDPLRLGELRALLAAAQPHEVLLVASSVADAQSQGAALEAFTACGASGLILTKLDEAACPGALADWLVACRLPLAYVTRGQQVPDDLEAASALRLAEWLLRPPGPPHSSAVAHRAGTAAPHFRET